MNKNFIYLKRKKHETHSLYVHILTLLMFSRAVRFFFCCSCSCMLLSLRHSIFLAWVRVNVLALIWAPSKEAPSAEFDCSCGLPRFGAGLAKLELAAAFVAAAVAPNVFIEFALVLFNLLILSSVFFFLFSGCLL